LYKVNPKFLSSLGFEQDRRYKVADLQIQEIERALRRKGRKPLLFPTAGSDATAIGISSLGGKALVSMHVEPGREGKRIIEYLQQHGVQTHAIPRKRAMAKILILVTPNGKRTMLIAERQWGQYAPEELPLHFVGSHDVLHVHAFGLEKGFPIARTIVKAMQEAKKRGVTVSIDLADQGVVERNRSALQEIIGKYVDIVFANEQEARALTGKNPQEAVREIAGENKIAVVKLGPAGSLVHSQGKTHAIPAVQTRVLDTTGAGDIYAAGFLMALLRGKSLKRAGEIASHAAARIVGKKGIKFTRRVAAPVRKMLE
ncbi:MAG: adenosine kinase, partial [Candidatus Micrarchaeota archaeon]